MRERLRFAGPGGLFCIHDESGLALFGVVVMAGIMMVLVMSVLLVGSMDAGLAARRAEKSCAFYLAEGGLACGMAWLEAQGSPPTGGEMILPFGDTPDTAGHGTYTVAIFPDSLNPVLDRPRFTVQATGHVEGHQRTLELDVKLQLLTDFLYFTDREHEPSLGNPLWFHSGDSIDGPLFTNDQISIQGDPTFMELVTSAYGGPGDDNPSHEPLFLYYNGDPLDNIESAAGSNAPHDNPDFQEGFVLGATLVDYPTHHLLNDVEIEAGDGGLSITGTYEIALSRPDDTTGEPMYGYVSYRKPGAGGKAEQWTDVEISSFNGLLYVNGSFTVWGTLDGCLTLATNGSVWISDDVVYRDAGIGGPDDLCDDLLGIIAGTDITIEENEPNNDDCEVHAAMVALDNCFRAENWGGGDPRGVLTVHGSIIQSYRGAVGTSELIGGESVVLTGYEKDYHYDWRLQSMSPPFFMKFFNTGVYVRLRWREISCT